VPKVIQDSSSRYKVIFGKDAKVTQWVIRWFGQYLSLGWSEDALEYRIDFNYCTASEFIRVLLTHFVKSSSPMQQLYILELLHNLPEFDMQTYIPAKCITQDKKSYLFVPGNTTKIHIKGISTRAETINPDELQFTLNCTNVNRTIYFINVQASTQLNLIEALITELAQRVENPEFKSALIHEWDALVNNAISSELVTV
jgi:hypothetical protein